MRIGFFTDGFLPQPHGVTTSVLESAKELEARGHEVYIIAPKYPGYVDHNKRVLRLTSLKIHKSPDTRISLNLPDKAFRKVMSMDFDIIHGHSGGPTTLLGWEVARAKEIPFVVTYHTLWNRYTHYFLKGKVVGPRVAEQATKIFGNRTDFLIAPTKRVERELRHYGVKKPIRVVPSGIDVESFKNEKGGFLREKIKNEKDPIALFVGRLGKEKSVDFLIRSFKYVYEKDPTIQLALVGDGSERRNLENLVKRLKLSSNVHFVGHIDIEDMHRVYHDADVFVFTSTTETQGLVVPEALASGLPVVAVDDPAYDCIENGKNGWLVKKDLKEFAKRTLSVIEDKEKRKEMSEGAQKTAEAFSVKKTVDNLESVYFDLVEKHNKESVTRIMAANERAENFFTLNFIFWTTVIFARVATLLFYTGSVYPRFVIGGQSFSHAAVGLVLALFGVAAFIRRRTPGFLMVALLSVGLGLVVDELWALFTVHATVGDYWSIFNLIPILVFGIATSILAVNKAVDRPKFYVSTREQVHENPEHPKVSVVIPAYNESEFITPTLKSLLNQTYKNFEIIVVDNNSTDDTGKVASQFGARVVKEPTPGVAAARQAGFFAARGEIICSTDADSVVPTNWIERIVEKYERNKNLVGFGGLNLLYSGAVGARAAGRYLFPLFWRFDAWLNGGFNMAGFNMTVRKSAFMKIGGFNPDLKMGEDIDLSQKLRTVGEVGIDPSLLVFSSGRRYKDGLIAGLMAYAPYWISKTILHKEEPFEFMAVRSERAKPGSLAYLPVCLVSLFIAALFYLANPQLHNIFKLF